MAIQKPVYSPLNHKGGGGKLSACKRLCISIGAATLLVLFLSSGGGGGKSSANDDNLRSGQANKAVVVVDDTPGTDAAAPPAIVKEIGESSEANLAMVEETELQGAVEDATNDIKEVEQVQVEKEEEMLEEATTGVSNLVRIGVAKMFGSKLTNDEVEEVAEQVEDKLKTETTDQLKTEADAIAAEEIDNVEKLVEDEEEDGYKTTEIQEDVYEQEEKVLNTVRTGIDSAAIDIKDSLKTRAAEIEKQILEERLSIKLGKKVRLQIVDDEVLDVDDLVQGLDALVPPPPGGSALGGTAPAVAAAVPPAAAATTTTTTSAAWPEPAGSTTNSRVIDTDIIPAEEEEDDEDEVVVKIKQEEKEEEEDEFGW